MTNGHAIGSLRLLRRIGAGGMGEVWLCRDEALGVDRAVKLLLPERAGDAALRARFAAEARILASLGEAPGIVRVHSAGEDPAMRRPFFAMDAHLLAPEEIRAVCTQRLGLPAAAAEAVVRGTFESHAESVESESRAESAESAEFSDGARPPGPPDIRHSSFGIRRCPFTLQDALGSEALGTARQLPERAVVALAREIAAALSFLHGRAPPIVHRDLKPANLLFAADGRLLLADFGVARTLDPARAGLTRTGAQPGTQRYAAPETLRGDPATPAADWYALGVVLFRALTSSFPQWGESLPTRAGLRPFSPLWEPLLRDLLASDPARRLADRAALSRRLDALERTLDRPRGGRRHAKVSAAAAALAAIALLGAGIAAFRHAKSAESARGETHAEFAESETHAEFAESETHAESAESAEHPGGSSGVAEPPPVESHAEFAESAENPGGDPGVAEPPPAAESAEFPEPRPDEAKALAEEAEERVRRALGLNPAVAAWRTSAVNEELAAAAVADDDLREFRESMERELQRLLPIYNPLDRVGLPPNHHEARKAQAESYGDGIKERYRKNLAELYGKVQKGETPTRADVERRRIAFPEWEAWLARKRAEDGSAGPSPGEVRTVTLPGGVPLDLVWVPPGTFAMGLSEKERAPCRTPAGTIPGDDTDCDGLRPRTVTLPRGFWLARTELTEAQWSKIEYGEAGSSTPYSANRPRILSWKMAERTIKKLNRLDTGLSFRFPTEAEWEWAARGGPLGGGHAWSGSDDPADVAWTANSWPPDGGSPYSADFPEVATKRPNELGLFDMAGSYSEWCLDRHDPPDGASRTDYRVLRGGSIFLPAAYCRNGSHDAAPSDDTTGWTGLRVAADEAP